MCPESTNADLPDGSRPVVHVTQGTVANVDYRQAIAPTLQALADENVLVVVSTGRRPLDTLPSLPGNARAATFLPYDKLLPRTDVYVTNGGYGGVQYALRCGVPIAATGGEEDKPGVGARVAWSAAGCPPSDRRSRRCGATSSPCCTDGNTGKPAAASPPTWPPPRASPVWPTSSTISPGPGTSPGLRIRCDSASRDCRVTYRRVMLSGAEVLRLRSGAR
ncbi:glycosyltransferase [Mycobacterium sp. ML4]